MTAAEIEIIQETSQSAVQAPADDHVVLPTTPEAEAASDDTSASPVVLVDQPSPVDHDWLAEIEERTKNRLPIVPVWLRSRAEALAVMGWLVNHFAYVGAYHLTRSPKYLGRLAARSPRGAGKAVKAVVSWTFDTEGRPVRKLAAAGRDAEQYLKLSKAHDVRVRNRLVVSLSAAVVLALGAVSPWRSSRRTPSGWPWVDWSRCSVPWARLPTSGCSTGP